MSGFEDPQLRELSDAIADKVEKIDTRAKIVRMCDRYVQETGLVPCTLGLGSRTYKVVSKMRASQRDEEDTLIHVDATYGKLSCFRNLVEPDPEAILVYGVEPL